MAFLDKLKRKIEKEEESSSKKEAGTSSKKTPSGFMQLDVDIYQSSGEIVIIAPVAGVEIADLDISIEKENDVVTIQGRRDMPLIDGIDDKGEYLRTECQWGAFYRQIILPQEVDVENIQAKLLKGILVLRLPLIRMKNKGKLKIEISS